MSNLLLKIKMLGEKAIAKNPKIEINNGTLI